MTSFALQSERAPAPLRAALELIGVVLLLEIKLWVLRYGGAWWLNAAIVGGFTVLMLASLYRRFPAWLPTRHTRRGWTEALAVTALLAPIIVIAAALASEPYHEWCQLLERTPGGLLSFCFRKTIIVGGQQVLIMLIFWPLYREIVGRDRPALVLTAITFGLVHLPLASLVLLTTTAAFLWIPLYVRNGCLAPIIASHCLLGIVTHETMPPRFTCGMTVGEEAMRRLDENRAIYSFETRRRLRVLSSERYYRAKGGTPKEYLQAAYRDIIGRPPRRDELIGWLSFYPHHSRARVAEYLFLALDKNRRTPKAEWQTASDTQP